MASAAMLVAIISLAALVLSEYLNINPMPYHHLILNELTTRPDRCIIE